MILHNIPSVERHDAIDLETPTKSGDPHRKVRQACRIPKLAPWQERRLHEHIAANLCDPLPLCKLASLVRLSTGHFARAFRQSFGVSPHTFIIEQRVNAAKQLILKGEIPLAQIALCCGMADQSHLTRHFTRKVGMSPAAWRRQQSAPTLAQAA